MTGRAGRTVSSDAIAAYERYLATPWPFRCEVNAVEPAPALERLGEVYEASGDGRKAAEGRTRLLTLSRRADAPLQRVVAAIRTRVSAPSR